MTIPLYFLLLAYGIAVVIFVIFFAVNVYHIVSTGTFTYAATVMTSLIIGLSIFVLIITILLLRDVSWSQSVTLWGGTSEVLIGF